MKRILSSEVSKYLGKKVKLEGWINSRRDHGKIIFIDLRDKDGLTQVVFVPDNKEVYKIGDSLKPEYVVQIEGRVNKRPKGMDNPKLLTGKVEVLAENIKILNKSKTSPFEISEEKKVSEAVRLKYRYLDLRHKRLKNNLILRHKIIKFIRDWLDKREFIEIETPLLTKSTPEGARDFLVPSRLQRSKFYALPQSPQQFKQLLMIAGFEKYFQIARCLRDEDQRGDRQAEHTQLDLEMSFVKQDDIMNLIEKMYIRMIKEIIPEKKLTFNKWPKFKYDEMIEKYGTDKLDLRKNKKDPNELAFVWITDFPLLTEQTKEDYFYGVGRKWAPAHNPFAAPKEEDIELLDEDPGKVKSYQYDLSLNGSEIAGGSIRINNPKLQEKIFDIIGLDKKQKLQFKNFLIAFEYGTPPHGGIASGIDRLLMILCDEPNIREVIAFPKTGDGRDLMMDAPSGVSKDQLKELHIKIH
jgi:aspartyl-tRNA synthetase